MSSTQNFYDVRRERLNQVEKLLEVLTISGESQVSKEEESTQLIQRQGDSLSKLQQLSKEFEYKKESLDANIISLRYSDNKYKDRTRDFKEKSRGLEATAQSFEELRTSIRHLENAISGTVPEDNMDGGGEVPRPAHGSDDNGDDDYSPEDKCGMGLGEIICHGQEIKKKQGEKEKNKSQSAVAVTRRQAYIYEPPVPLSNVVNMVTRDQAHIEYHKGRMSTLIRQGDPAVRNVAIMEHTWMNAQVQHQNMEGISQMYHESQNLAPGQEVMVQMTTLPNRIVRRHVASRVESLAPTNFGDEDNHPARGLEASIHADGRGGHQGGTGPIRSSRGRGSYRASPYGRQTEAEKAGGDVYGGGNKRGIERRS